MARVIVNLDDGPLRALLDQLRAKTNDFRGLFTILANTAVQMIDRRFRSQGPGWTPLKAKTLARRRKHGAGAQILQDTGRLRNSIVARASGPDSIFRMESTSLEMGSNLVYAATHQWGRNFGRGNPIPARPYLPTTEEFEAEVLSSGKAERYIRDILGGR